MGAAPDTPRPAATPIAVLRRAVIARLRPDDLIGSGNGYVPRRGPMPARFLRVGPRPLLAVVALGDRGRRSDAVLRESRDYHRARAQGSRPPQRSRLKRSEASIGHASSGRAGS